MFFFSFAVVLYDSNGAILDAKPIQFKAIDTCIYCSDGQCNCTVSEKKRHFEERLCIYF